MRFFRFSFKIFLIFWVSAIFHSCVMYRLSRVDVVDYKIESVSLSGLSSMKVQCKLLVDNPEKEFSVRDIEGEVVYEDRTLMSFVAEPFIVQGRGSSSPDLKIKIKVAKGFSLLKAQSLFQDFDKEKIMVDCKAKVRFKGGMERNLKRKIPLSKILNKE